MKCRAPNALSLWTALATLIFLTSCATSQIDWNSRVGNYSYDQAVLEMGPPDRLATLTDGTKVAEWLTSRGGTHGTSMFLGGPYYYRGFYGPPITHHYYDSPSPDRFVRLTFGPDGKLRDWRKVAK